MAPEKTKEIQEKKELKKQVKEFKKKKNENFELDIVNFIKKGLNPAKISVKLNLSMPNLQYYLSSLKKQNVIKKVGYGTWEVMPVGEVKILEKLSHKGKLKDSILTKNNLKKILVSEKKDVCLFCNIKDIEIHHLKPKNDGGKNSLMNMIPICKNHHKFIHSYGYNQEMLKKIEDYKFNIKKNLFKYFRKEENVRGHAFIWKVKPEKIFDWKKLLNKKRIKYVEKGISKTPRIKIDGRKVWLGKTYITIFETDWSNYFAINPIESKKKAIFDLINIIEKLKKITGEFKYKFTCKRQHYGFIDNEDAKYFIKKGKRILIKNEKGYWFSIDFSDNKYKEAETIHSTDADIDGLGYQRLMNSHERTNFKVTPEFVLNTMNGIQQNQLIFDRNMKSHLEVLDKLGSAVDSLRKAVEDKLTHKN